MRSRRNSAAPLLMLAAAASGLAQQTQPPRADEKPASVTGEVRNAISGMPIERAHISLRRYNNGGWDKYGALTNAEGKYTISGIPAATYQVALDRVGFVPPLEVTRNGLVLKAGEKKDDFKVKLVPVGAISGRVLDAEGQPVEGINVYAETGSVGQRTGGVTDDRGQFRIGGISPGKYRVRAVPQALPLPPEIRTDGTAEVFYAATYHPGAVDEKGATRVVVGPGTDVTGVDIRMVRTQVVRVAGKVSGMPEGAKNVFVQMMQANGGQSSSGGQVKADGSFEIWRPNPGKYNLRAMYNSSGEMMASGAVEMEVGESDIDNIELRLLTSEDIRVQVNFDDEGAKQAPQPAGAQGGAQSTPAGTQGTSQAPPPRPRGRITLRELNGMGQMKMADVTEDVAFTIPKVMPGKYLVSVTGYAAYVKTIRLGETTGDGPVLNLNQGSGGAAVTVTLSSAYGEISGTVQDDKGPAAGAHVAIRDKRNSQPVMRSVASGADGTYSMTSVAPGMYQLLVVDESESHTITSEPGTDDFDEMAETVEVRAKETVKRDLKVRAVDVR
jgi:large repetitive protein